jgi:hypothetical protein
LTPTYPAFITSVGVGGKVLGDEDHKAVGGEIVGNKIITILK